jgi:hypothetical protein
VVMHVRPSKPWQQGSVRSDSADREQLV